MMQQMLLALLLLPTVFYFGLLTRSIHRALLTAPPKEENLEGFWGSASSAGIWSTMGENSARPIISLWSW